MQVSVVIANLLFTLRNYLCCSTTQMHLISEGYTTFRSSITLITEYFLQLLILIKCFPLMLQITSTPFLSYVHTHCEAPLVWWFNLESSLDCYSSSDAFSSKIHSLNSNVRRNADDDVVYHWFWSFSSIVCKVFG